MAPGESEIEASWHRALFGVFREMHTARDFRLTLCADAWGCEGEYAMQLLRRAVAVEKAARGFDHLLSELTVVYSPRESVTL
jgi:hypothetical protein